MMPPMTETPRCAIDEDGKIIYANDAFIGLGDLDAVNGHDALEIFTFSNDILGKNEEISALDTGEHQIYLGDNQELSTFYFDWLTTPDNRRILIASATDNPTTSSLDEDMEELIRTIQGSNTRIESMHREELNEQIEQPLDHLELLSMSNELLVSLDTQGHILFANETFFNTLGYSREGIDITFLDMFAEEDRANIRSLLHGITREQGNNIVDFEARTFTADGERHWIDWKLKSNNEKIYLTGQDVTETKAQQEDLHRRELQLSEAEAIGRMGHWHWLIGDDNVSWSEEIFRIFGVDQNQFSPSINNLTDLIHKRDLGRVVQVFQRAIIEEKNYDMEFRITRPGGDVRFIHCEGRCEKDIDGEVIALFGIMQDMTERMLYEQELRAAKDASEQAYIAKSRFLANMSHELRTPLNAIIGFSEMIESQMLGPIFNEKYLEYATNIKDSGTHLLDLISDILDMSKIESGKHKLDLEEVNIKEIIDRATHMVLGRAQEQNINLRTNDVENSNITITGDRRALTQVLLNLLSNAIKFTKENGSVWVECYPREDYISLRVCDTGIGIPPNKLASVLRPFEQVSSEFTREHEGTGLGLSITKELIELHGGSLTIESTVEIGTTVTVRLPLIQRD